MPAPTIVRTHVADIFNGRGRAYIYVWVSKAAGAVYVGQTAGPVGSLGRGQAHFRTAGTLRKNMDKRLGVEPEDFNDFVLISYPLPLTQQFIGPEKNYREAVEFLVDERLRELRGDVEPSYTVISWVQTNDRTRDLVVRMVAKEIVDDFLMSY